MVCKLKNMNLLQKSDLVSGMAKNMNYIHVINRKDKADMKTYVHIAQPVWPNG